MSHSSSSSCVSPPSVERFNSIPNVTETHHVYHETEALQRSLIEMTHSFGVANTLKPCTLHTHFPIDEGQLLLITTVPLRDGDEMEVARGVDVQKAGPVHPVSFLVEADGTVRAYKFAPGSRALTEAEKEFLAAASSLLVSTGEYQRISFKRPTSKNDVSTTEVEIPEYKATVLFPLSYAEPLQHDDHIVHAETAKNEAHELRTNGNHTVFFKKAATGPVAESAFRFLVAECGV